jgi:Tfp pilus assembly protein PilO
MEFETLMKLVIGFATLVAIPVGAYAAITATRAIWVKGEPKPADPELKAQVETLEARVLQLEADQERMLELEERVDFAERVLAKRPDSVGQLPDGR